MVHHKGTYNAIANGFFSSKGFTSPGSEPAVGGNTSRVNNVLSALCQITGCEENLPSSQEGSETKVCNLNSEAAPMQDAFN